MTIDPDSETQSDGPAVCRRPEFDIDTEVHAMRAAEMTLMDAKAIFDHDDNYPLTVTHQGRTDKLDRAAIAALRQAMVDFEVDDREAALALFKYGAC